METIQKKIINFYNKRGFLETYGTDLYVTIFIILFFFVGTAYFIVMNNLEPLKSDWPNQRCNPSVIPFAGIINAPEGTSKFNYTAQNFSGCINNILKTVSEYALQPIHYVSNVMISAFKEMTDALQSIRAMFNKIRNSVKEVSEDLYSRSLNITIPIMQLFINAKDMIGKVQGMMTSGLFTLFGSYLGLMSLFGVIYSLTIKIILIMIGIIVVSLATFNFGFAAAAIAFTIPIAVVMGLIAVFMRNVLNLSGFRGVPKVPHCFDGDVKVNLLDGTIRSFKDLEVGDKIFDGSVVTSFMKMSSEDHVMYNLRGIVVTGSHKVFHEIKGWILVSEHPESIKIDHYNDDYIYCIGTSNKMINLGSTIGVITFSDWDEFDDNSISEIKNNARKLNANFDKSKNIHKYLDGGFTEDTEIELQQGDRVKIKDIKVNDVLKFDEKVLGIVKIDATNLSGVYEYYLGDKTFKGGPNLQLYENNLGIIDTTKMQGNKLNNVDFVYHLITDKRTYFVNGFKVCDYNSCTEKFMNNERFNILLSTLI
jgi:hypothetical protein